jgi:hypothetical protein
MTVVLRVTGRSGDLTGIHELEKMFLQIATSSSILNTILSFRAIARNLLLRYEKVIDFVLKDVDIIDRSPNSQ